MRYINDARFLPKSEATNMVRRSHPEKKKASFLQMLSPGNRSKLRLFGIIAIITFKTLIKKGSSALATVASTNFLM